MAVDTDFSWSSQGGVLMDGTGDIADTAGTMASIVDIITSRLKGAVDAWKLYNVCAGLRRALGQANSAELAVVFKRRINAVLTDNFLSPSDFTVEVIQLGSAITAYIYAADGSLLTTVTTSTDSDDLEIS